MGGGYGACSVIVSAYRGDAVVVNQYTIGNVMAAPKSRFKPKPKPYIPIPMLLAVLPLQHPRQAAKALAQ